MAITTILTGTSIATIADNDVTVVGGSGVEKIKILTGVTGVTVNPNIDNIDLAGSLADYRFVFISGTGVQIQNAAGTPITTIPSINPANLVVAFADGSASLTQTGGSTFALGSASITTTAAAITTTQVGSFNTAVKSTVNPAITSSSGQTFTLTTGAVPGVATAEGNTVFLTVTPNAAVSTATTLNVSVTGQALGGYVAGQAADFGTMPSVTFAAGATAPQTVTFSVLTDTAVEGIEAYKVALLNSAGIEVGNSLTGIINDAVVGGVPFTLTTGIDNGAAFTGGTGNDTFNATHLTFGATDVLVGGTGIDTLTIVDTGTAALTLPVATVSGIENINIRNLNGTAAVAAVAETSTATFSAMKNGQYLTVAGVTLVASADLTAAQVASAMTGGTVTGASVRGTITGWTVAANPNNALQAIYTQTGTAANVADLSTSVSGTVVTGQPQLTVLTAATNFNAGGGTVSFTYNGVSLTTATLAGSATPTTTAVAIANSINSYAGSAIATASGPTVVVQSNTPVSLAGFTASAAGTTFSYAAAPMSNTIAYTNTATGAAAAVVAYNGVNISTATLSATSSVSATATAVANAINTYVGSTVAVANGVAGEVVIAVPSVIGAGTQGATQTFGNTASSSLTLGVITALPLNTSTVQGVAAAAASGLTDTVVATNFTDATTFTSDSSTGLVNITGLTAAQTAVKQAGAGGLGAGFGATVTAGTIDISGGSTAGAVDITGIALLTQTINSTGAANTIGALTGAATATSTTINATTALTTGTATNLGATVTVNGAGNVSFGSSALQTGVTTLNATGLTGTLTVALSSLATQVVTGGSGNDVITTGGVLTTGSVNAGVGTGDVLVAGTMSHINTLALGAKYTNFEILRLSSTANTLDMATTLSGITAVQVTDDATLTNMTATQAGAVTIRANAADGTADTMSFALATATGTSDVLTITAGAGTTTQGATDIGGLTVTGFETVNIRALPGPTSTAGSGGANDRVTNITGTITGATLANLNLTGTSFNIANGAVANATAGVNINASALTGNGASTNVGLVLAGNLFAGSVVTGSDFQDQITLGTVGSTYSLGAGNDTIIGTLSQYRSSATYNTIDAGAGTTDTATISDGAGTALTITDDDFKGLTNVERIVITDTTTGAQSISTGGWFDNNFKTAGATLTTTSTTGAITIAAGTFSGNLTLTTTSVGTSVAEGRTTITTGSGNDTITVNLANSTTTNAVVAGAGNDTIVHASGTGAFSFTGGTGADTMTGLAGTVDTYVFANTGDSGTPSSTNFDKITNWVSTSDVIDFASSLTYAANATSSAPGVAAIGASANSLATFNAADNTLALQIVAIEAALTKSAAANNGGTTPTALNATSWVNSGDTYVFVTDGTAGVTSGDTLIQLTGVTNTGTFTITGGNIVAIS
jgi:hypothetical protein